MPTGTLIAPTLMGLLEIGVNVLWQSMFHFQIQRRWRQLYLLFLWISNVDQAAQCGSTYLQSICIPGCRCVMITPAMRLDSISHCELLTTHSLCHQTFQHGCTTKSVACLALATAWNFCLTAVKAHANWATTLNHAHLKINKCWFLCTTALHIMPCPQVPDHCNAFCHDRWVSAWCDIIDVMHIEHQK